MGNAKREQFDTQKEGDAPFKCSPRVPATDSAEQVCSGDAKARDSGDHEPWRLRL